jgi:hypothetical protein
VLDYDTTMRIGRSRYQDVLDHLAGAGLPATFTQTGGMCAALEVMLDSGHTLLVTDADDTLSWDRREHSGWGVGLYPPDQTNTDGECLAFDSTGDGTLEPLLPLVDRVLQSFRRRGAGAR